MRARLLALFALVGIIWGSEWRVTRDLDSPPLGALALRYAMAAVVLGAILLVRRIPLPTQRLLVISAITGITFAAAPVLLIGWARERVSPGIVGGDFGDDSVDRGADGGPRVGGFTGCFSGRSWRYGVALVAGIVVSRNAMGGCSSFAGGRGVDCGVGHLREEATC